MAQLRGVPGFAAEVVLIRRRGRILRLFECDRAVEFRVGGAPDDPHAAGRDLLVQPVAAVDQASLFHPSPLWWCGAGCSRK
jgi:hypothetical protein